MRRTTVHSSIGRLLVCAFADVIIRKLRVGYYTQPRAAFEIKDKKCMLSAAQILYIQPYFLLQKKLANFYIGWLVYIYCSF